jgi:hypothetical protein
VSASVGGSGVGLEARGRVSRSIVVAMSSSIGVVG